MGTTMSFYGRFRYVHPHLRLTLAEEMHSTYSHAWPVTSSVLIDYPGEATSKTVAANIRRMCYDGSGNGVLSGLSPRKMMAIRFTAWRGVNWDTLKLPFTEFTVMVNCGDILPGKRAYPVTRGAKRKTKRKAEASSTVRATISFPPDLYQTLEEIASQKKVSLAWIVREASEQYIADKWPLLVPRKGA